MTSSILRRALVSLIAVAASIGGLSPVHAQVPDPIPGTPAPGYFATDNVEWLLNIPINTDSAGARIHGSFLYVTEDRGLTIYDISDPELPLWQSFTPLPQMPYWTEEDVDTNGKILLIGSYGDLTDGIDQLNKVSVIDVTDKTAPEIIGEVQGADNHTISCVLDCTWAYGSGGTIVDLRDPTQPKIAGSWRDAVEVSSPHDVTEVAPGIVMTSSRPLALLDARVDPAHPTVIATATSGDNRFIHGNLWPHQATDRFLLVGGETGGDCDTEDAGAFMTFEQQTDPETGELKGFQMIDEYRLETGLPTDGRSPYDQYCAHWFTTHPTYDDGGLIAMGWYEHGTRFLDISDTGEITEKGFFVPVGGSTSAAYWVTDEIVYVTDYQRGIDVLRFTGEPATGEVAVGSAKTLLQASRARDVTTGFATSLLDVPRRYDGIPGRTDEYLCPLPV